MLGAGLTMHDAPHLDIAQSRGPAFDQPRTPALPLPIVCHLLGSGNQLHPTGLYQPALPLSHRTPKAVDLRRGPRKLPFPFRNYRNIPAAYLPAANGLLSRSLPAVVTSPDLGEAIYMGNGQGTRPTPVLGGFAKTNQRINPVCACLHN